VAADLDNDGWTDIYVACDMTPSLLYHNRGDGTFEERGVESGVAYNANGQVQAGMGVAVADFDGDGFLDIAKTNFSGDLPSLYKNEDGRFFTDVSQQAGLGRNQLLGWGVAFLDVDEDGWKDIVLTAMCIRKWSEATWAINICKRRCYTAIWGTDGSRISLLRPGLDSPRHGRRAGWPWAISTVTAGRRL
jgi:hypothetical protein